MSMQRPPSDDRPRDQSSKTPSGKNVPTAMSMMVDSMVRMIQKATKNEPDLRSKDPRENIHGN